MFSQFRAVYPMGSLISELLVVDENRYIVRVLVVVDNTTLSTGMAAAESLEVAEDRARIRALSVLGLEPARVELQGDVLRIGEGDIGPDLSNLPLATTEEFSSRELGAVEARQELSLPLPVEVASAEKKDLSDEIAAILVLIRLLGWTPEQGKAHLMATYNKSSSKELNPDELVDFRRYLESQIGS